MITDMLFQKFMDKKHMINIMNFMIFSMVMNTGKMMNFIMTQIVLEKIVLMKMVYLLEIMEMIMNVAQNTVSLNFINVLINVLLNIAHMIHVMINLKDNHYQIISKKYVQVLTDLKQNMKKMKLFIILVLFLNPIMYITYNI